MNHDAAKANSRATRYGTLYVLGDISPRGGEQSGRAAMHGRICDAYLRRKGCPETARFRIGPIVLPRREAVHHWRKDERDPVDGDRSRDSEGASLQGVSPSLYSGCGNNHRGRASILR